MIQRLVIRQLRWQQDGSDVANALVEEAINELLSIAPEHPTIAALMAQRREAASDRAR